MVSIIAIIALMTKNLLDLIFLNSRDTVALPVKVLWAAIIIPSIITAWFSVFNESLLLGLGLFIGVFLGGKLIINGHIGSGVLIKQIMWAIAIFNLI